jgi:hypothetical protein
MASRNSRKKRKKRKRMGKADRGAAPPPIGRLQPQENRARPTPVAAIAAKHAELATRLAARADRFSQLLSRSIRNELSGGQLVPKSGLSARARAELDSLSASAHAGFQQEIGEATSALRSLLAQGDPLYILSVVQTSNLLAGRGEYYEPTHSGFESKVELVAGLLLTQPAPTTQTQISDQALQAIYAELDRLLDLSLLLGLSAPKSDDAVANEIRFIGRLQWITLRGTSYEHHGRELAQALTSIRHLVPAAIRVHGRRRSPHRSSSTRTVDHTRQLPLRRRSNIRRSSSDRGLYPGSARQARGRTAKQA